MQIWSIFYLAAISKCVAFVPSIHTSSLLASTTTRIQAKGKDRFFAALPNIFGSSSNAPAPSSSAGDDGGGGSSVDLSASFEASSMGLIRQSRRLLASDFGILDPSLLDDDDFVWIGPFVDEPLGKVEYLAAGRFFDLRVAFPDLDYRPHDFRVDEDDPYTIRITCRVTGTMRGALRLRDGTLAPTGKRMKCPPEAVTINFNKFGKVTKLCTGFCLDRQVGNTKGATGVMAAALVAGQPLSDWDLYPAPAVVKKFFGRPVEQLLETKSVLAPFPETVMTQLAKGVLATNMASNDPSLLSEKFQFCTPYKGPIQKKEFLEKYALEEFENVDPSFSHFRVDPYDPVRVWVDVLPKGVGYQGAPQAMSFSFDEDGFCERITSSYVMDPSIGNGGGLGGPEGYRYAMGQGTPDLLTRPLARVVGRVRKQVLSPFTGVGVDDYITAAQAKAGKGAPQISGAAAGGKLSEPQMLPTKPIESLSALKTKLTPPPAAAIATSPPPPPITPIRLPQPSIAPAKSDLTTELIRREQEVAEEEAKLKLQGAEEAQRLIAEMEAAERKALEAKEKLAKLQAQQMESERRLKLLQERGAAEKAAAAAAASKSKQEEDARKASEQARQQAEKERLAAAKKRQEMQERKAKELEQARASAKAAADKRLKEIETQRQTRAEERRKLLEAQRQEAERKRQEAERKRQEAVAARAQQIAEQKAAAEARRVAAAEARLKMLEQREAEKERQQALKQKQGEKAKIQQAAATAAREESEEDRRARALRQKQALESLTNAMSRATISLFGFGGGAGKEMENGVDSRPSRSKSVPRPSRPILQPPRPSFQIPIPSRPIPQPVVKNPPPRGVPVLKKWKKTASGAITGVISGSRAFADGERVTTSPITSGTVASGEVVRTGSGSRYYLE